MFNKSIQSVLVVLAVSTLAHYGIAHGQDLAGIKCVVKGDKQVSADAAHDYKDGKAYFCCQGCLGKFKAAAKGEANEYATKANHQLVLTGQYVQTSCPISGGKLNADVSAQVGGALIGFCCGKCQAKVNAAEGLAAKAELVFADAAFKKGFVPKQPAINLEGVKCVLLGEKDVNEKFSADYGDHKVFFCCNGCKGKFAKDPEKFATMANHQLVVTGQVVQVGCPISGQAVDDEQVCEVGGLQVKMCCGRCKAKVDQSTDAKKLELVFGKRAFDKAYGQSDE